MYTIEITYEDKSINMVKSSTIGYLFENIADAEDTARRIKEHYEVYQFYFSYDKTVDQRSYDWYCDTDNMIYGDDYWMYALKLKDNSILPVFWCSHFNKLNSLTIVNYDDSEENEEVKSIGIDTNKITGIIEKRLFDKTKEGYEHLYSCNLCCFSESQHCIDCIDEEYYVLSVYEVHK